MRPSKSLRGASIRVATVLLSLLLLLCGGCESGRGKKILIIGGADSEGPGRHDYPEGMRELQLALQATPQARDAEVLAFERWPGDAAAWQDVSTVVLYFDGNDQHPLRDAHHRRQLQEAMRGGVGLVALHQASTVPAQGEPLGLRDWLGAERVGLFDRTTETATLVPASSGHAVLHGVQAFRYRDEFYPTLRFAEGVTPLLRATLHVQYRDGAPVLEDRAEDVTVGWAYQRADGGRAFGYTGGHFLAALAQPMLRRTVLNAILWTAGIEVPETGVDVAHDARPATPLPTRVQASELNAATFHADRQRSGWHRAQPRLAPARVRDPSFGLLWQSPALDADGDQSPKLYASPLYLDRVTMGEGPYQGQTLSVLFAATNLGYVYAINAAKAGDLAPGRILWRTRLAPPCQLQPAPLDAVPTGVLSTPVIDIERGRLYVTSCDPRQRWQAYALDIGSGQVLPGWPVKLDEARFNAVNRNAGPRPVPPKRKFDFRVQRGALNLNADGTRLYVTFGETETGWLVSVDTLAARVHSAFAASAMPHRGSGGMWGAGGPAVDADDAVFVVTGSGFDGYKDQPNDWTQSLLKLADTREGLTLAGTYTPFNHCTSAKMDIDLGSGGASLLPALDAQRTRTPRLLVVGGKQGNAYLLDRARLPGDHVQRPACDGAAASDGSLLPPTPQPQFGTRGPLNVFGPYSEQDAALNLARARSVPAGYRDERGDLHIFMTGNSKRGQGDSVSIPPSVVRLEVVAADGDAAYLRIAHRQRDLVLANPGSPVISSTGGHDAVVWVLDENAPRSALLSGPDAPAPVLYALDADTLDVLWKSAPGQLHTSGKYNEPVIAAGAVVVGTDRLQAFGHGAPKPARSGAVIERPVAAEPKREVFADSGLDGATLFQQRCAMCHDHPQGNIPPRAIIASRSQAQIVEALTRGVMRAQASGLSERDIEAVAEFVRSGQASR